MESLFALNGVTVDSTVTVAQAMANLEGHVCGVLDWNVSDGTAAEVICAARNRGLEIPLAIFTVTEEPAVIAKLTGLDPSEIFEKPDFQGVLEWVRAQLAAGHRPKRAA
jgi:hypothetical protein